MRILKDKRELSEEFDKCLKDYYRERKICNVFHKNNPSKFEEIYEEALNVNIDNVSKYFYKFAKYKKEANAILCFLQRIGKVKYFEDTSDGDEIIYTSSDLTFLAVHAEIKAFEELNQELFEEAIDYCYDVEYSEDFMDELYDKFVGSFSKKYPSSFDELVKIADSEREMLDALFFSIIYEPDRRLFELLSGGKND